MLIDETVKALGDIKIAIPHKFSYTLTAEEHPIHFTKITTGCGSCTTANITKSMILAGEEIELTITFTPAILGANSKNVYVEYTENDIKKSQTFTFTANVVK